MNRLDAHDSERPCSSVASEDLHKLLQTHNSDSHSLERIDNLESDAANKNIPQSQEEEAGRAPSSEPSHDSAVKGESNNHQNLTIVSTRIPYPRNLKVQNHTLCNCLLPGIEEAFAAQQQACDENKPHQCSHCGKRFHKQAKLRIHLRVHTGEKPYQCTQCGKYFSQAINLRKHHRTHHTEERPYHCTLCDRRFSLSFSLIKHQRVAHPGEITFLNKVEEDLQSPKNMDVCVTDVCQ